MYIKVHVGTDCKEEKFEKKADDSFLIHVKEKPERGLANKRVIEMLRSHFGPAAKAIRIVSGYDSPSKLVSVDIDDVIKEKKV